MEFEPIIRKRDLLQWVPLVGLTISFYSAIFATFILYPWHLELSKEMKEICTRSQI